MSESGINEIQNRYFILISSPSVNLFKILFFGCSQYMSAP